MRIDFAPHRRLKVMSSLEIQTRSEGGVSWKYMPVTLDRDSATREFRARILPVVRPTWKECAIETRVFTEGITNSLFGFYPPHNKSDTVLLRINGEGTEKIIDRRNEIVVMISLHRAGLIPPVYLQLANGLCYGYVPGRPFTVDDMQDNEMMQRTACTVARLHAVPVPDTPHWLEPQLWKKMAHFMGSISGVYRDPGKTKRFKEIFGTVATLQEEVDALQLELRATDPPLVFCHNDLLCGNLIYDKTSGTVSLVDYEYGGANCAAYDIGNHFCEFAGITDPVDYGKYPCRDVQYKWIRYYLQESYRLQGRDPEDVRDRDIYKFYQEVNKYALAAHIFWMVWSLLQATQSTIDFDYVEYAGIRFKEYKRRKEEFLNL